MNSRAIEKFANDLKDIAQNATSFDNARSFENFSMHDGVGYSLKDEQRQRLGDLINSFMEKGNYSQKFSEKYLEEKIKKIFADIISGRIQNASSSFTELCSELDSYAVKNIVYLPIDGVTLEKDLNIGKVTLRICNRDILNHLIHESAKIIETGKDSSESKKLFLEQIKVSIEKHFSSNCIAQYEVVAEPIRAYERAKDEVRRVTDILRFSIKAIYPITEDIRIGLRGDYPRTNVMSLVFSETSLHTKSDNVGSVRNFIIDDKALDQMKKIGATKLASFLTDAPINQYKECLLRATHWFSSATTQLETENSFLHLIIALESLFTQENGNPITNTVAESTALLIANNLESRKEVKARIKRYYGIRSGIAHGGKKEVSEIDLLNLIYIVQIVIIILLEKSESMQTQKDLMQYIEDLKLS